MAKGSHIDVTVDFTQWGDNLYDLRIPTHQTVRDLLLNLSETLKISPPHLSYFVLKVKTKQILLTNDERLSDYPITDGDVLVLLTSKSTV